MVLEPREKRWPYEPRAMAVLVLDDGVIAVQFDDRPSSNTTKPIDASKFVNAFRPLFILWRRMLGVFA